MRRVLVTLLALALVWALPGCGAGGQGVSEQIPMGEMLQLKKSPYGDVNACGDFSMSTEWPSYAPGVAQVTVLLENQTGAECGTGVDYALEALLADGAWYTLDTRNGQLSWPALERILPAHDTVALNCDIAWFDTDALEDGTRLRIVKTVDGAAYAAEFTLSADSPITPETPFGFAPLEELAPDYPAEQAAADGCAVFAAGADGSNRGAVDVFLTKVRMGIPAQLRIQRFTSEGDAILEDVFYERVSNTGRFRYRCDSTRDNFAAQDGRMIWECVYSYLVTDAWSIYLSNFAAWGVGDENARELFYGEDAEPYIPAVQALTDQTLAGNVTRFRVWDGERNAGLTDQPEEFFTESPGQGQVFTAQEVGAPAGTEMRDVIWFPAVDAAPGATGAEGILPFSARADAPDMLVLVGASDANGLRWHGVFDAETGKLAYQTTAAGFAVDRSNRMLTFLQP